MGAGHSSDRQALRSVMPRSRGTIDRLPYSPSFESAFRNYNQRASTKLRECDFWRAMLRIAKSRIRKHAKPHVDKAIEGIQDCINTFNMLGLTRRHDAVMIDLHWSFEQILKAAIIQNGGSIRENEREQTISFNRCKNLALTNEAVKFLSFQDWTYLGWLQGVRGAAYHDIVILDESELYLLTKTGIGLFDKIMDDLFFEKLADRLEARVLPISTVPLVDITVLLDRKETQIRELAKSGETERARHAARSLAELELLIGLEDENEELTSGARKQEIDNIVQSVLKGERLSSKLPHCSAIEVSMDGSGPKLHLSLVGRKNPNVEGHLLNDNSPAVAYRNINPAEDFQLSHTQLAAKLAISTTALTGIMRELKIHDDKDLCYAHGPAKSNMKQLGFHVKTLAKIKQFLLEHEDEEILSWYRKHVKKTK